MATARLKHSIAIVMQLQTLILRVLRTSTQHRAAPPHVTPIALASLRAAISWQSLQDGAGGTVSPPPLAELRLSACIAQQLKALVITRPKSSVFRRSVAVVAFSERPTWCSHRRRRHVVSTLSIIRLQRPPRACRPDGPLTSTPPAVRPTTTTRRRPHCNGIC
jgi:hypothetical protein